MPPAALTSSAAMMMPLCVEVPKVACEPVREPYSPMRISPVDAAVPVDALPVAVPVSPFGGQPASDSDSDATSAMKPNFRMSPPPKSARILQQSHVHKAFRYCCNSIFPDRTAASSSGDARPTANAPCFGSTAALSFFCHSAASPG